MTDQDKDCSCLRPGLPRGMIEEIDIGVDETKGRFADVTLSRCPKCRRLWLRYQVEYPAFTASGRWAECPISEADAAGMTPEEAVAFINEQPLYIYGGSYWGHAGKRGSGAVHWD